MNNSEKLDKKTHIRRCHICGTVNENQNEFVKKCDSCGKSLVPFLFFDDKNDFDPALRAKASRIDLDNDRLKSGSLYDHLKSQYPPLWGITVYW